ncbi:MAG: hypothetical protein R3E58_13750 [Phycisphaerae bacterium]
MANSNSATEPSLRHSVISREAFSRSPSGINDTQSLPNISVAGAEDPLSRPIPGRDLPVTIHSHHRHAGLVKQEAMQIIGSR